MTKIRVLPNQLPLPNLPTAETPAPEPVPIPDYAMWVGGKFYPTPESYVEEAERLGCSKRLPGVPEDLVVGQSRVYLTHARREQRIAADPILTCLKSSWRSRMLTLARKVRDGKVTRKDAEKLAPTKMPDFDDAFEAAAAFVNGEAGVVFGYFVVTRLEFVVPPDGHVPDKIKELAEKGHIRLVPWSAANQEANRGCGRRKPGGTYAAAYVSDDEGIEALRKDAKDVDIHGSLAVFRHPFRAPYGFFRGTKKLASDELAHVGVAAALVGTKDA